MIKSQLGTYHMGEIANLFNWQILTARAITRVREFEVSEDDIRKKNEYFTSAIAATRAVAEDGRFEEAYGDADRLADKLRNYRRSGLESGGEFSVENLVFKSLRNSGAIEELYDLKKVAYDAILSIDESQEAK